MFYLEITVCVALQDRSNPRENTGAKQRTPHPCDLSHHVLAPPIMNNSHSLAGRCILWNTYNTRVADGLHLSKYWKIIT